MRVGIIVALSMNNVMAKKGSIPWHHPLDLKRFASVTRDSTVIMGRKTWETLPKRDGKEPLAGRIKRVVSSSPIEGYPMVSVHGSLQSALDASKGDVWVIGGKRIYEEAMATDVVQVIDITRVMTLIDHCDETVYFDPLSLMVDQRVWECHVLNHPDPELKLLRFVR